MTTPSADEQPILYVLDEDFVPPDRGDEQEGPSESATEAGDPEEAVRLFHRYRRLTADILGYEEELPAPASGDAITAVEQALGFPLPADLRALYATADGDGDLINPLFNRHPWHVVSSIVDQDDEWLDIAQEWEHEPWREVVFDTDPPGAVRRSPLRDGWLRFANDTGGNWLAVDMDPGPDGRPGQVISVGVDYTYGPIHLADSVTTFLRLLVEALERGDYRHSDGNLWIDSELRHPARARRHRTYVDDRPTVATAAQAGPRVQEVRVSDVTDCAFLTALPPIRSLTLRSKVSPDLSPVGDHPVEYLALDVESVDLTAPARNQELRSLSLTSAQPVDLAPLRTLPHLWALDIAAASGADIGPPTQQHELRYLEVTQDQWEELSQLDDLPPLALVGIHPHRPNPDHRTSTAWDIEDDEPPSFHD